MLRLALIFFVMAVFATVIGFCGLAQGAVHIAGILAVIGLILAIGVLPFHHRSRSGGPRI